MSRVMKKVPLVVLCTSMLFRDGGFLTRNEILVDTLLPSGYGREGLRDEPREMLCRVTCAAGGGRPEKN